jgi:lipopolysaccharide export system permease protein
LLGLNAVSYLPVVLTLTAFIAVLLTFSRWYRDSEMIAWMTSGMSLASLAKSVLLFSLPMVALIAGISLEVAPWANRQSENLRTALSQRPDFARIVPGTFVESGDGNRVIFVEATERNHEKENRFPFITNGSIGK